MLHVPGEDHKASRLIDSCLVQDTGTMQLVSDDVVNEALESDHLALQNMSGSKYVQVRAI